MMAQASILFQDDYKGTREPQHVSAANKRQTLILDKNYKAADLKKIIRCISTNDDIDKNNILGLLGSMKIYLMEPDEILKHMVLN
jgi:hypothetical protein